jgi:type I restriction enzyme, S subunit
MSDWPERPLGDLLEVLIDHRGKTPKKLGGTDFTGAGVPVVSAIHIKGGRIQWSERERYVPQWMFEKWMPERLQGGDVLLTSEAPLGAVAQVPSDDDLVLSQRLFALRGKAGILDCGYLRYFLESPPGQHRLTARSTGTTATGIRQAELVKVCIPLPRIDEQRRITSVLGALDDLIEANRQAVQAIDSQAEAIFERSMSQCEPAEVVALSRLVERGDLVFSDGYRTRADQLSESGIPILRVADVLDAEISPSYKDHILESFRQRMGVKLSKAHDVVITTKGTVGRIALVPPGLPEHAYSPQLCFLRAIHTAAFSSEWLYRWARSAEFMRQIGIVKDQTDMAPYVSLTDLRRVEMTLPTPSARRAVEGQLVPLTAATEALRDEIADLMNTRNELLPLLMSGKVRVSEDLAVA